MRFDTSWPTACDSAMRVSDHPVVGGDLRDERLLEVHVGGGHVEARALPTSNWPRARSSCRWFDATVWSATATSASVARTV